MADELLIKLEGIDELKRVLKATPDKIRKRAVRSALRKAAAIIRQDAKARAPILGQTAKDRQTAFRAAWLTHRFPGTVKRRISVRPSKFARQAGDEGVFVGVRPLRGQADTRRYGKASAKNPNDPFYWRFLEFGTKKMTKRPFLGPAAKAKGEATLREFMRLAIPEIQKLDQKR